MARGWASGWAFVGREDELERSRALVATGTGVLILGEAGIGKSALAAHLVGPVGTSSATQVLGRAVSSRTPYEAFASLLDDASGGSDGEPGRSAYDGERPSAADVAARVVGATGTHGILLVDDIHLLDEDSAHVVLHLAAEGARTVVATARSGQLPETAAALWRSGLCERVELAGLSPDAVAQLLEAVLEGPVGLSVAERFARRSQGNPLLLRELVQAALTRSALVQRDGVWVLDGEAPLSGGVRDLVAERLADLDEDARTGLEAIAAGEPLPAGVALDVVGEPVLARLEQARLVTVTSGLAGPEVHTAHPLYGEVLRADLPGLRLRRIRLELAAALEATDAPAPHDLVRAATWRLDSGQADDPERLLAAARAARAVSLDVAERLARRAHETQRSLPATVLLAEILTHRGRGDEAAALTSDLPPDSLSGEHREALTYIAAVAQGLLSGDTGGGADLVAELAAGEPLAGQYLHAAHAAMLAFDARLRQALDLGLPIVLDPAAAPETRTLAAVGAIGAEYWLGRTGDAVHHSDLVHPATLEPAARQALPFGASAIELLAICALLDGGDLDAAEKRAEVLRHDSIETGDAFGIPRAEYCQGRIAMARGQAATAVRRLQRCIAAVNPFDQFIVRHLQSVLARALAMAGEPERARAALAAGGGHPAIKTYEPDWDLAEAAVLAAELRMDDAAERAAWAARVATDNELWLAAVIAFHDAARYGAARQVLSGIRDAAAHVDGPLPVACVDHVTALATGDAGGLDAVAARFHGLGRLLLAVEAAAAAALQHQVDGHPRAARASGDRAAQWLTACEAPLPPWLAGAPRAVPLTARERQVAALASCGYSDLDIARRLSISTRTVQTHLAHVYAKVGINRRSQLREQLGL